MGAQVRPESVPKFDRKTKPALRLGADVLADPLGGLYTPPVALHDALALLRPQLSHPTTSPAAS
jgi:hypothetical protein